MALLPVLVGGLGGGGYWWTQHHRAGAEASLEASTFYTVVPMDLDVKISKDGELQAINNTDIACHVEGANTITYVIPEGTNVKQGDLLVTLESSTIKQRMNDLQVTLDTSRANLVTAQQFEEIQVSQNQANLESAQITLDLSKLDLEAYTKGLYPQASEDAKTQLKAAEETLSQAQDDYNSTMALFGKGYVTPSDVKKSELATMTATQTRDRCKTSLMVLTNYQHKKDQTNYERAVVSAQLRLDHTAAENRANLTQRQEITRSSQRQVKLLQDQFDNLKEQFDNCSIKAPTAGFVIYASSLDRNAQVPIQEGTQVRDKQLLIRLPDTSGMKAIVRIPEAQRSRISVDEKNPMRAVVRIPQATKSIEVTGWVSHMSAIADMSQRWINPDLKEYPVDVTLDWVPPNLKPSDSVKAEIYCEHLTGATAVPLDCVYSSGADNYVFRRTATGVEPQKVMLGESTETFVQVAHGLASGTDVLRLQVGQGRDLLERAGIKAGPSTMPSKIAARPKNASPIKPAAHAAAAAAVPAPTTQAVAQAAPAPTTQASKPVVQASVAN